MSIAAKAEACATGRGSDVWYPLPRRGVRVVDGAALEKRCAKAPRVRIPPSPPPTRPGRTSGRALASPVLVHAPSSALAPVLDAAFARTPGRRADAHLGADRSMGEVAGTLSTGRGRLVDYGAALEMRFGATRRGFESRPLRHLRHPGERPWVRWPTPVLAHARSSAPAAVLDGRLPLRARPGG